ncbi:MAG: HigA family addiction module antidote protein [Phycisphaerales bacterium]|nr:HigA family addiction module antidote protein [Phycisphaerales bacterium]
MLPRHRIPTHPGSVLRDEFLSPLGVTQLDFAAHIGVPIQRVNEVVRGRRGITPETGWLFAQALGTTPEFWLNLQASHDLAKTKPARAVRRLRRTA